MYKKCKVIMLPTDGKAILGLGLSKQGMLIHYGNTINIENDQYFQKQHLYILSDDEIKDNDYYIEENHTFQTNCNFVRLNMNKDILKVIASTDSSLTVKDTTKEVYGKSPNKLLPSIPQSFIDLYVSEFNKGNKIEEVMVEYDEHIESACICDTQEKLTKCIHYGGGENCMRRFDDGKFWHKWDMLKLNSGNTINIRLIKDSWTREEVIGMLNQVNVLSCHKTDFDLEEWIESNL
jgi:hypothetical protein